MEADNNGVLPNYIMKQFKNGWTVYHEAASRGDIPRLFKLIKNGEYVIQKNYSEGNTPLHEAAVRGYSRCVVLLCESLQHVQISPTINMKNNYGFSALHLAAQNGHKQCCRELLLRGSNPNICNCYGDTPLHSASRYGHTGVIRVLISALCDRNLQNNNGDTALHIACAMGNRKLVKILLKSNSSRSIMNMQGYTPIDITRQKQFKEIEHLIRSYKDKDISECELLTMKSIRSPYGCQTGPNFGPIFLSNVELLSQIKLQDGEQYYFDLAGTVHKGPKSYTNICYCDPLIDHSNRN
ncbi:ankyrin repeat domain-containing protein 6 isoform X2 [Stomoxys calcitrans]|uniref:ankyrin repeat domain-containing protein 6 isoform X2 n=1 Tax=Stomoxys calcitrans TaxID=35570 RepID=UPI0027E38EDE|nr:ankyrin repeat domain-containing protein 6 isoform X2 [Stomoxys calcitrans]XP_059225246.1 ankyrin repeat domain-containing protein 6 isoform X2 [Stomoxys calcitrans]